MTVIVPGLCSVTFRSLGIDEVADRAAASGLTAIEWGGDIHVPTGDERAAVAARRASEQAGIDIASYGSYYGISPDVRDASAVVATAVALGAPNIRAWAAGTDRARVVARLATLADAADSAGITVSVEFHPGTETETAAMTRALLDDVPSVVTYWQPDPALEPAAALRELEAVLDRVSHLHVFSWAPDRSRLPLADGSDLWPEAFAIAGSAPIPARFTGRVAFLEFVAGDDPAQLAADATTLRRWLAAVAA